jgi:uncharacterized protein (DUF1684 family)
MNKSIFSFACIAFSLAACDSGDAETFAAYSQHSAEVEEWRIERLESLRAEDGYLNLAGLFWLEEGRYSFGSSSENDIQFPPAAAAKVGEFEVTADGVFMTVAEGVNVVVDGEPVQSMHMRDDTSEAPVTASSGELAWVVVNREGKIGVRLRDFEHPALLALPPIPHFAINPEWRVEGTLIPFAEPKVMDVGTVIEGLGYNPTSPGVVAFEFGGERFELEAYIVGERLFFVFGDQTSGRDTYPAGRFFYATWPDENGKTVLDFNKSYNPPCAFGDFSTCPVASPKNRLKVRIEAGEKYIPALHVGSLTSH